MEFRKYGAIIFLAFYTLLLESHGKPSQNYENVFQDHTPSWKHECKATGEAEFRFINDPNNETLQSEWEEALNNYATFKKKEANDIAGAKSSQASTLYLIDAVKKHGDTWLNETEWKKLVSFSIKAGVLRAGTPSQSRDDTERFLSGNGSVDDKFTTWSNWYNGLSSLRDDFTSTLNLVSEAARLNGENGTINYWELISGYKDGYRRSKIMWQNITKLHDKVVKFVRNRLSTKYNITFKDNYSIPAHLLGSLQGNDWIPLAAYVVPDENMLDNLTDYISKSNRTLYELASNMTGSILEAHPRTDFWTESEFNGTCSTRLVDLCNGETRVSTCQNTSLADYLTAHKVMAKVLTSQMNFNNYSVYNTLNRHSGLDEAVSELFSISSVSPSRLTALGVDTNNSTISSLMITALDVLPRLGYYMSADLWRLEVIEKKSDETQNSTWWEYRRKYENVTCYNSSSSEPCDIPTFLDDDFITSNKPYLSKFVGAVLAFQLHEILNGSKDDSYDSAVKKDLIQMLQQRRLGNLIPEVTTTALTTYFAPLEKYLDENSQDDFPSTSTEKENFEERSTNSSSITLSTTTMKHETTKVAETSDKSPTSDNSTTTMKSETTKVAETSDKSPTSDNSTTTMKYETTEVTEALHTSTAGITASVHSLTVDVNLVKEGQESVSNIIASTTAIIGFLIVFCVIGTIAVFGRKRCVNSIRDRITKFSVSSRLASCRYRRIGSHSSLNSAIELIGVENVNYTCDSDELNPVDRLVLV